MKDTQSQEHYEDALFALLIQTMWEEQGQVEQNQTREAAGQSSANELDRRCLGMIRKHYGKEKAHKAGKALWKVVSRVAVAACLAVILFTVAYATSETVRVNTLNFLIEMRGDHADLRFSGKREAEDREPSLSVGWVPERYTLVEKELRHNAVRFEYEDADGNPLIVACHATYGMTAGIDTENAVVEDVTIQGSKGMFIEKDGEYSLVWPAKNNTRLLDIIACGLSREELFQFAEALAYD